MNKLSTFFANMFLTAFRHLGSIVISIILIIVGSIWSEVCLYIGMFLLISNILVAIVGAIRMQRMMEYRDPDDPNFNDTMDRLTADPQGFLAEIIGEQSENRNLHGAALLTLDDDELFDAVYYQNLEIAGEDEDTSAQLERFTGARRVVFILSLYDAEVQNGGLCQFFVNSSRAAAPCVCKALKSVGASEHLKLFEEFIAENNIDVCDLESFKVQSHRGYVKQTKRFDFDAFDDKYYDLPALQESVVEYIKNNINEF